MLRWPLLIGALIAIIAASVAPSEALPRGKVGSKERDKYCEDQLIQCTDGAQDSCGNRYPDRSSAYYKACLEGAVDACNSTVEECYTSASKTPVNGMIRKPGGQLLLRAP
jgi:hypothetical protein